MKSKIIFTLFISVGLLAGCQHSHNHDEGHEHEEEHGHAPAGERPALSYTIWTDKTELFVEFPALVVGEESGFAAHFTYISNFKAVTEGTVTVSLSNGESQTIEAPSAPGIFRPVLQPEETGSFDLTFTISTPTLKDTIQIEGLQVFAGTAEAIAQLPEEKEDPNEISFLKEQAWKIDFANVPVERGTIYEVIKAGGQLDAAIGDQFTLSATANGVVVYNQVALAAGTQVKSGQALLTITGGNMAANNIEAAYSKALSNYEKAQSTYERKKELYEAKAISKADYEVAENAYELAKTEYHNLAANFSGGGKVVKAPFAGYVDKLYKGNGDYTEAGEPLMVIGRNQMLTLTAQLNQGDYPLLNDSISANFVYNGKTHAIEDFNGSLLSYGKTVDDHAPSIPVKFNLENKGGLLPGSYTEVWIKTNPVHNALTIPKSALLEEYGSFSVMVQTSGEGFEKREVKTGVSDGARVQITTGLAEGERVVTKGAYQVKMASMSGQAPAHGHAH